MSRRQRDCRHGGVLLASSQVFVNGVQIVVQLFCVGVARLADFFGHRVLHGSSPELSSGQHSNGTSSAFMPIFGHDRRLVPVGEAPPLRGKARDIGSRNWICGSICGSESRADEVRTMKELGSGDIILNWDAEMNEVSPEFPGNSLPSLPLLRLSSSRQSSAAMWTERNLYAASTRRVNYGNCPQVGFVPVLVPYVIRAAGCAMVKGFTAGHITFWNRSCAFQARRAICVTRSIFTWMVVHVSKSPHKMETSRSQRGPAGPLLLVTRLGGSRTTLSPCSRCMARRSSHIAARSKLNLRVCSSRCR